MRTPTNPVTILPLGDSITEGGPFPVYRYPLMERLKAAGLAAACVGSKTTGAVAGSSLGALRHEGYSGKSVEEIADLFGGLYPQNPADVILLHSGHNHSAEERPVPGMIAATRRILDTARAIRPDVVVLLAQVVPSGKLPKYAYIPEFNEAVRELAGERVVLVDHALGFDWRTDTIDDRVHPSASGAAKMAVRWFEALKKAWPALPAGRIEGESDVKNIEPKCLLYN